MLYHEQMKEIQSEREAVFGLHGESSLTTNNDLKSTAENYLARSSDDNDVASSLQPPLAPSSPTWSVPPLSFSDDSTTSVTTPRFLPPGWDSNEWDAKKAGDEREVLYEFTDTERDAWRTRNDDNSSSSKPTSSSHDYFARLAGLRNEGARRVNNADYDDDDDDNSNTNIVDTNSNATFSHLTPRGDGIHMVDVGNKVPSRRVAIARTVVIFPPEVLSAFHVIINNNSSSGGGGNGDVRKQEMIGPKGPIFETAKIAGIMGAKQTSNLIPLCHPLPLDYVAVDIQLVANQAIIECKCSVTHTTGVEMEALMGASVAALTIYDMVKAVSHNVIIGQTVLVSKSGGKSDVYTHDDE